MSTSTHASQVVDQPSFPNDNTNNTSGINIISSHNRHQLINPIYQYTKDIKDMMYTFGDCRHPLTTTSQVIEDIVHDQLVDIILQAVTLGTSNPISYMFPCYDASTDSRPLPSPRTITLSIDDILFAIRHDELRSHKLREFLAWKEVRRTAKDTTTDINVMDDDLLSDGKKIIITKWDCVAGILNSNESLIVGNSEQQEEFKNAILTDWQATRQASLDSELQEKLRERLKHADQITRDMSHQEYMAWTECRQASFTFKKSRRFKEWIVDRQVLTWSSPRSFVQNVKMSDEVVEVLGFLAYEMVGSLVTGCLDRRKTLQKKSKDEVKVNTKKQVTLDRINKIRKMSTLKLPELNTLTPEVATPVKQIAIEPDEVLQFMRSLPKSIGSGHFKHFSHALLQI